MTDTLMTETNPNDTKASQDAVPAPRATLRTVLSVLVVALVVVCAVMGVVLGNKLSDRAALESARGDALASGRQAILNLDSLSAATIDRDLTRVLAGSTGAFKESFTKAQVDLKTVVKGRGTTSTGTVLSAAVERADTDTATVLVAVDRSIKDSSTPKPVVAHDRWKLSMEKHGGRWLVADLQPVS